MIDESVFSDARLCIVGNLNRDVKIAPVAADERLFADGETSTESVSETVGGGGANCALAAAALRASVTFAGKVGDDAWGGRLEKTLRKKHIRALLARDPKHPTGTSINLVFTSGHRHFISHLPSSSALAFDDIPPELFTDARHLLRADIWFSKAMLFGGNERLLKAAKDKGLSTSIDLNWDPEWGRASINIVRQRKDAVRKILPLVDLAHGNIRELNMFADTTDIDEALRRITAWGVRAVVLHWGKDGAGHISPTSAKLTREPWHSRFRTPSSQPAPEMY